MVFPSLMSAGSISICLPTSVVSRLSHIGHIVYSGSVFLHVGPPRLSKPDHTLLSKPQRVFLCYFPPQLIPHLPISLPSEEFSLSEIISYL